MLANPEATVSTEIEEDHEILMKFASFFGAKVDHIFHCSPFSKVGMAAHFAHKTVGSLSKRQKYLNIFSQFI